MQMPFVGVQVSPLQFTRGRPVGLRSHYARRMLFGVAMILIFPAAGHSQTVFSWPDSRIDVGTYESIESCLAASVRVRDSLHARSDTLFDTLPPSATPGLRPVPPEQQTIIQRCLRRFPVSSIPLTKFRLALELFLLAGDDAAASKLVARGLATIPPTDSVQRASLLDSAIFVYLNATTPIRLDSAKRLMDTLAQFTHAGVWKTQIFLYRWMMLASMQCDRPELGQRYGQAILSLADAVANSVKAEEDLDLIGREVIKAKVVLYHDMLMDSLRTSLGAYANVKRQKLLGSGVTGSRFPELHGDFVFPASAKEERFPRPGKLTLVVGILGDRRRAKEVGFAELNRIRRIKQQFPALDIVLVAPTNGVIVPLAPPSPAEEAALFEKMVLEFGKLPATLIVYTTPFFSVSDPDRRKIELSTEWDKKLPNLTGRAVLVDGTGSIIEMLSTRLRSDEKRLFEVLQIVYDRALNHSRASTH